MENGARLALGELFGMPPPGTGVPDRKLRVLLTPQFLAGAGMFVTTVVVGSVGFFVPFTVTRRPFMRDVIAYFIATSWVTQAAPLFPAACSVAS